MADPTVWPCYLPGPSEFEMKARGTYLERMDPFFLTLEEAIEAVCIDFRRYEPQIGLLCQTIERVSNGDAVVKREGWQNGAWVRMPGEKNLKWMAGPELVTAACTLAERVSRDPQWVASICARVFHERAWEDTDPKTGAKGVRIETGMETFSCRQCGRCCTSLDYHDELTEEDVADWRRLGRTDILQWVRTLDREGDEKAYKIWTIPGTTRLADTCPFLKKIPSENRWECTIHDVKPRICRQYPLTRKHGLMTGCRGFERKR